MLWWSYPECPPTLPPTLGSGALLPWVPSSHPPTPRTLGAPEKTAMGTHEKTIGTGAPRCPGRSMIFSGFPLKSHSQKISGNKSQWKDFPGNEYLSKDFPGNECQTFGFVSAACCLPDLKLSTPLVQRATSAEWSCGCVLECNKYYYYYICVIFVSYIFVILYLCIVLRRQRRVGVVWSVITYRHDKTSSGNRQLGDRSQAGPDAGGQPATQLCEPRLTQKYQTRPSRKCKYNAKTNTNATGPLTT